MKFYVAVIYLNQTLCGCIAQRHWRSEQCPSPKTTTKTAYKFRTSIGQAKADITRNKDRGPLGKILVGNTDDLAPFDLDAQSQHEFFESRMLAHAQDALTLATAAKPKKARAR